MICVETRKEQPVAPYFCDPNNRLDIEVRTCNDEPCPPRWKVSDFTLCTKSCGGGIQTRTVACIQEVAHGGSNVITLDNAECPQPPPTPQQFCSVIDCTAEWHTQQWTKVTGENPPHTITVQLKVVGRFSYFKTLLLNVVTSVLEKMWTRFSIPESWMSTSSCLGTAH